MSRITRRVVLAGSGLLVAGLGGLSLSSGLETWLRRELTHAFGEDIARAAEDQGFITDYIAYLRDHRRKLYDLAALYFRLKPGPLVLLPAQEADLRHRVIATFLRSTNLIRARETGAAFTYAGIFDPKVYACSNQLGHLAL